MPIEEPKFTLATKDGAFELRDYAVTIVAEVSVTGDQHEASRKGFRLLAGYIFGGNRSRTRIAMTAPVTKIAQPFREAARQKIAMTSPVTQTATGSAWLVRFTMPRHYALTDLPVPNDPAVTLKVVPATRFAVLRFSGLAGEAGVADATTRLMAIVRKRRLVPVGPSSVARYNPPWTLWFLRRNEVMVPVAGG
jgi:hypothetical protein